MKFKFLFKEAVLSDERARQLTQAFLDGDTTPDEENALYRYYSQRQVASDLAEYREMFGWYASLGEKSGAGNYVKTRLKVWSIAASVAVLLCIGLHFSTGHKYEPTAEQLYAGSYIIRDGKKITDINQILPELEDAQRTVDKLLASAEALEERADIEPEILPLDLNGITDNEIREMIAAELL